MHNDQLFTHPTYLIRHCALNASGNNRNSSEIHIAHHQMVHKFQHILQLGMSTIKHQEANIR